MAKTIWKFQIVGDLSIIAMPKDAEILAIQKQFESEIVLSAAVDPYAGLEQRRFAVVNTGGELPQCRIKFLATVQFEADTFVRHVFERFE